MFQVIAIYVLGCWVYTLGTFICDAPVLFSGALRGTFRGMSVRWARLCFVLCVFIATFLSPVYLLYTALVIILPRSDDA